MLVFVERHVSFPGCIWKRTFLWTMGIFDDLLGVQPSVLGDVSSCTFVLVELASKFVLNAVLIIFSYNKARKSMLRKQTNEQMGDWSLPKKHGENFCGRPLCCRAASTRCSGFWGQKSKTSRVVAVANFQVWMEEFMKHIYVYIYFWISVKQACMSFEITQVSKEFPIHLGYIWAGQKTTLFPQNDLALFRF